MGRREQTSAAAGRVVPPAGPEKVNTPSGRRTLDRLVILREAVRFIDVHGRDRLTMRRLGAELGVEAMALYRYVLGRTGPVSTLMEWDQDIPSLEAVLDEADRARAVLAEVASR